MEFGALQLCKAKITLVGSCVVKRKLPGEMMIIAVKALFMDKNQLLTAAVQKNRASAGYAVAMARDMLVSPNGPLIDEN